MNEKEEFLFYFCNIRPLLTLNFLQFITSQIINLTKINFTNITNKFMIINFNLLKPEEKLFFRVYFFNHSIT